MGPPYVRIAVLCALLDAGRSLYGAEITRRIGTAHGQVYPVVRRLKEQGLVRSEMRSHPTLSGQCVHYWLTTEGRDEAADIKARMPMPYVNYTDRMKVTVPEGEVDGLRVQRFEVIDPESWTEADDERTDVISPLEYVRMMRDGRECMPGWYTRLSDANEPDEHGHPLVWMSDTTAERGDHKVPVAHIHMGKAERVLINGLGLGMVLQAALSYRHVRHVDVVEKDERVIGLVGPHYVADPRVRIHHADAYEQMEAWPKGTRWDVAWSDVWSEISADNIDGMDRLHAFYRKRSGWHGMWCRKECLKLRRELASYGLI